MATNPIRLLTNFFQDLPHISVLPEKNLRLSNYLLSGKNAISRLSIQFTVYTLEYIQIAFFLSRIEVNWSKGRYSDALVFWIARMEREKLHRFENLCSNLVFSGCPLKVSMSMFQQEGGRQGGLIPRSTRAEYVFPRSPTLLGILTRS